MNIPIHVGLTSARILRLIAAAVLLVLAGRAFPAYGRTGTILHSFDGAPDDGRLPYAGLVQGSDSNFYGTTYQGGSNDYGTIFRVSPSGSYTTLYSFAGPPNDGGFPWAPLVQSADNNFYGTTYAGGTSTNCGYGCGTIFRISPGGVYTTLYSFAGYPDDGFRPKAGLVEGSDSNFYGTTEWGGSSGAGTLFRIDSSGTYTILYSFGSTPPHDGMNPQAGLTLGSDSNFYGTTAFGGAYMEGTMFRITPSGSYSILHSFGFSNLDDGSQPQGNLVQGSDSNFYGTTRTGGISTNGTIFRISPGGAYTNLYSFAGSPSDGSYPAAPLVQGSDGNLYGTTVLGGRHGHNPGIPGEGTVFRISPSGVYTNLCSFGSSSGDGKSPFGGLILGSDGDFYGTTSAGGAHHDNGTLFKFAIGAGGICAYTLNPTSVTLGARGGLRRVHVKVQNADCVWTAVSNDSFITITAGTNGVGKGTVTYTTPANTSTNVLTGTITIAGGTFTVTQSGQK